MQILHNIWMQAYTQWGSCPYATNPTQAIIVNTYFNPSLPFYLEKMMVPISRIKIVSPVNS